MENLYFLLQLESLECIPVLIFQVVSVTAEVQEVVFNEHLVDDCARLFFFFVIGCEELLCVFYSCIQFISFPLQVHKWY